MNYQQALWDLATRLDWNLLLAKFDQFGPEKQYRLYNVKGKNVTALIGCGATPEAALEDAINKCNQST